MSSDIDINIIYRELSVIMWHLGRLIKVEIRCLACTLSNLKPQPCTMRRKECYKYAIHCGDEPEAVKL